MRINCNAVLFASFLALLPMTGIAAEKKPVEGIVTGKINLPDNPPIRVQLMDSTTTMSVMALESGIIVKEKGAKKALFELPKDASMMLNLKDGVFTVEGKDIKSRKPLVLESATPKGIIAVDKVPYGVGWWWASFQNRKYSGKVTAYPAATGKIEAVLELPLETYMRGVTPSEIGADAPLAALCAQTVAGRSAAVLALTSKIYAGANYDICSDVACQAFSGLTINSAESDKAVEMTRGTILSFEGRPVSAYYASNCGGVTEDIRNVWNERANDKAYWNSVVFDGEKKDAVKCDLTTDAGVKFWIDNPVDCYCNPKFSQVSEGAKKNWRWERQVSTDELSKWIAKAKSDIGTVTSMTAVSRGQSGRMIEAEFIGDKGRVSVGKELAIRNVFDPPLRSAVCVVETSASLSEEGKAGKPGFVIRGAGWGHGVGMCQTGAIGMGRLGKDYKQILTHYYPNTTIEKLY